uniref:Uncharacterized protein n=1 Tax=Clavaria fumosa TaxID=264083 RepID=A0A7T3PCV3_9AGAR|nr:hypothetical protein KQ422_mgp043 [Clavaria fumosa]QPZ51157.1 hypothetical protein [Clavaria fumosa]
MIRDIFKKYLLPGVLVGMSADSWHQSRFGSQSPTVVKAERDEFIAKFNAAQDDLSKTVKTLQDYQNHDVILRAKAHSITEANNIVKSKVMEIGEIKSKLMEAGLWDSQRFDLLRQLDQKNSEFLNLIKEHTNSMIEFTNEVKKESNLISNQSDIVSNSVNTYQNKVLDFTNKVVDSTDNVVSSTELSSTDIKQSSVLGSLSEMKVVINEELATLSSEQLGCLTNLLGFIMILGGMVTITLILFGEYLINYFKLDQRYPKLVKYIKLRQTFNKYYLIINIIIIYLILILYIVLNFYMIIM